MATLSFISDPPVPHLVNFRVTLSQKHQKGGKWMGSKHSCLGPALPQGPRDGPKWSSQRESRTEMLMEEDWLPWEALARQSPRAVWEEEAVKVIQLVTWVLGINPCLAIKINSRWIKRVKGKNNQSMGNKKYMLRNFYQSSGYRSEVKTDGKNHQGQAWQIWLHKHVNLEDSERLQRN